VYVRQRIQLTGTNRPRAWKLARARYGTLRGDRLGRTRPGRPTRVGCAGERTVSGGHGGGETPVPIPNTAVKPASADGTWGVAPWESRTPPGFSGRRPQYGGVVAPPELRRHALSFHDFENYRLGSLARSGVGWPCLPHESGDANHAASRPVPIHEVLRRKSQAL
jgi:hypothetical protein